MVVAVLFARSDSVYKRLPGTDVFDLARDARTYRGASPVVAHPPCRGWGRLRHLANPRPGEKECALFAVDRVRACGGVLEHPAHSTLWSAAELPSPGARDRFGGFTFAVYQSAFGHRADKATWLYICGIEPAQLPSFPLVLGDAPCVIASSKRDRPEVTKAEREATPEPFALWLLQVAELAGRAV